MKRILLDTHTVLFWWAGSAKLSATARDQISDEENIVYVSAATGWEIATKFRIGKLAFAGDPALRVPQLMADHGFRPLIVTMAHALSAGTLDGAHRDPFDRLIAAQALMEDLVVVTRDPEIANLGCQVLW